VTGREYKRPEFGPAPAERPTLHREMQAQGLIRLDPLVLDGGLVEKPAVALVEPDLQLFTADDMRFVDESIEYYWDKTGIKASDDSHGAAWNSRNNGDLMPYELAYLSDHTPSNKQFLKLRSFVGDEGLSSL